ncbi:MAG: hypothetical protein R3A11_04530 [Bdellovibrionota bacterium]
MEISKSFQEILSQPVYAKSSLSVLTLKGSDARDFLQRIVTVDMKTVQEKGHSLTNLLGIKGKIIAFFHIVLSDQGFWLLVDSAVKEVVIRTLEAYIITEDIALVEHAQWSVFQAFGEKSREVLEHTLSQTLSCSKGPQTKIPTYYLWGEEKELLIWFGAGSWMQLSESTAEDLRIFEGQPRWGQDVTGDHMPFEIPFLESFTSTTKGCYPGQETVSRLEGRGRNVAKKLFHVVVPMDSLQSLPQVLLDQDDQEVGQITSLSSHEFKSGQLGLAWIHRKAFESQVHTIKNDQIIPVEVLS